MLSQGLRWALTCAWACLALDNGTNVVFVRIQKTGSKSLLQVLEQCAFTMCAKRPVDAVDSVACARSTSAQISRNMRSKDEFACYVASHCPLSAFGYVLNNTLPPPLPPKSLSTGRVRKKLTQRQRRRPPLPGILLVRRSFVLTILRDPVARTVSEYRHVCAKGRGQWDYSTHAWREKRADVVNATRLAARRKEKHAAVVVDCEHAEALASFVTEAAHTNGMRNRQVRMLGGAVLTIGAVDPRPEAELYARAKHALNHVINAALIFERFDVSLIVLAHKLGLRPPKRFSVVSEAIEQAPKPNLDAKTAALVLELNQYDKLLHDEAARALEAEAAKLIVEPQPYACDKVLRQDPRSRIFSRQEKAEHHYFEAARCALKNATAAGVSLSPSESRLKQRAACEARIRTVETNRTRAYRQAYNASRSRFRARRPKQSSPADAHRRNAWLLRAATTSRGADPRSRRSPRRPGRLADIVPPGAVLGGI